MKVYVSGPMALGDMAENLREAMRCGAALIGEGHAPYIPQLSFFLNVHYPISYERWIKTDLEWVKCCQALIRLPGASSGAEREIEAAHHFSIPVFYGLEHFLDAHRNKVI